MKKINLYIIGLLSIATLGQSCKKELVDINTNPSKLSDVNPEFLFTGATVDINLTSRDRVSKKYGTTMTYMQYVVTDGATPDALAGAYWNPTKPTGPNPGFGYYNDYFTGVGRDMHRIIDKINTMPTDQQSKYQGLKAMSSIVDVYHAWRVADIFGALPYSQGFDDILYPKPTYDFDYSLYKNFDAQLKSAATLLKTNSTGQIDMSAQDLFFKGDYTKWLNLANTLRIKIAQRYEKRDAAHLTAVLNDVAANFASSLITGIAGSFSYYHTQGWNNNVDDINVLLLSYNAAFPFVEYLKSTSDPRIKFMVRENDLGDNYKGYLTVKQSGNSAAQTDLALPENQQRYWGKHVFPASADNGFGLTGGIRNKTYTVGTTGTQSLGRISAIQTRLFLKNGGFGGFDARSSKDLMHTDESFVEGNSIKMRTFYLSYAETCFMMAEIAQKGGNGLGKTAVQWFNEGVQASFDQYKAMAVATNVPNAATTNIGNFISTLKYQGLPSIYSQAWVNYLMQPDEAWAMWKRTGYPQFENVRVGQANKIGDGSGIAYLEALWDGSLNLVIPRRNSLPLSSGSSTNTDNYNAAIQAMIAKDAAYGAKSEDTFGRIWWDMR